MYYFASDVHLGAGDRSTAHGVEMRFVEWLKGIEADAEAEGLFLCGDIFDFWFEYDYVVPKGFTRTLAQLARLTERGLRVVFMAGNHDQWIGNYLSLECGMEIYTSPQVFELSGRRVHVAHGDNLNVKNDIRLTLLNKFFRSNVIRTLFSTLIHPNAALRFGLWWSSSSRKSHVVRHDAGHNTLDGLGVKSLVEYASLHQEVDPCDYYIYGHLHQRLTHRTSDSSGKSYEVILMNDWSWSDDTVYATLDGDGNFKLNELNQCNNI